MYISFFFCICLFFFVICSPFVLVLHSSLYLGWYQQPKKKASALYVYLMLFPFPKEGLFFEYGVAAGKKKKNAWRQERKLLVFVRWLGAGLSGL